MCYFCAVNKCKAIKNKLQPNSWNLNAAVNHHNESKLCFLSSFNQLCLPTYDSYEELHKMLKLAISEGSEGFGMLWPSPLTPQTTLYRRTVQGHTSLRSSPVCSENVYRRDSNAEPDLSLEERVTTAWKQDRPGLCLLYVCKISLCLFKETNHWKMGGFFWPSLVP